MVNYNDDDEGDIVFVIMRGHKVGKTRKGKKRTHHDNVNNLFRK